MARPNNWYHMSYEEQRAWERQDREREDLEYRRREAEEALERQQRDERRLREEYRNARSVAAEERSEMRQEIDEARERSRHARAFIRSKGLWEEFKTWQEPEVDPPLED